MALVVTNSEVFETQTVYACDLTSRVRGDISVTETNETTWLVSSEIVNISRGIT